jgi:hypothetical protein
MKITQLEALIGRWITEGETVPVNGVPAMPIVASDVYEWGPGGQFVVHTAYGRAGEFGAGGVEIIRYDPERDAFRTHFFHNEGAITEELLTVEGRNWQWGGTYTSCDGSISEDGTRVTANHFRSDDGVEWTPTVEVRLTKID